MSVLSDLTFWNVASGINTGYSEGFDLEDVTVVNGPEFDPGCSDGAMCDESGISLADGGGGNTTQVRGSRVDNVENPIVLSNTGDQSVVDTTVDGRRFRAP